jgi:hypothetical protein
MFANVKILFTDAILQLIMEYTSGSLSPVYPEERYSHDEHPLLSYWLWQRDQKRLQKTSFSLEDYVACMNEHSITSASCLFKIPKDKNCDCFVFRKAGRCFHVLNFVEAAELHEIIKLQPDCPLRSIPQMI